MLVRSLIRIKSVISAFRYYSLYQMAGKKALVFLAPGAEEMEFVISVDVLRRGGVEVTVASLADKSPVICSRGVVICPDAGLSEVSSCSFDAVVLPGGLGGSKALAASLEVGKILKHHETCGKIIAAICAAPTALKTHCIGFGKNITSYPSTEKAMLEGDSYNYKQDNIVVDGTLITSRGPGTAYLFALTLLEQLAGKEKAREVAKGMLVEY